MISLFDVIESTENTGARIVSENNDRGSINWQAGMGDLAEMVKLGKYDTIQDAANARA